MNASTKFVYIYIELSSLNEYQYNEHEFSRVEDAQAFVCCKVEST